MNSIVIFGAGNVASHLFNTLSKSPNFKVVQVFNHREEKLQEFREVVSTTSSFSEIFPADIYLIAVKDEAISQLAAKIKHTNAVVLHTSGSIPASVLNNFDKYGVFYPLQTFSKNKPVDFKKIPICIETNTEENLVLIEKLATELSKKVYRISSEQRKALHVAAVFVSNFVNLMYSEGENICRENSIPFEILHPLIQETAEKITTLSPREAQTGPAKRNDLKVINTHLQLLNSEQKEIYKILTQAIQNLHGKEL